MKRKQNSGSKKKGGTVLRTKNTVLQVINQANNETIVPKEMREHKSLYYDIDVVKKTQKGVDYFSGEMSLLQLAALTHVDNYDGDYEEGKGQRALSEARGKQFMNFIMDRENVCFMEILLNEREGEIEFVSLSDMGIAVPQHSKLAATHGILRIPSTVMIYVYDGQTRRFGYISLLHFDMNMLDEDAYKDFQHLKIPFCLCQVSASEETKLFLQHNKQMSVPNDHKAMVSWHINQDQVSMKNHTPSEAVRTVVAGMTYMMDNDRTNPWYQNIAMPNLSLQENKKRLGSQGSFNTGLKQFIGWLKKNYWTPETSIKEQSDDLLEICTVYWRAIRKICPKIWRSPENYIQLRSQGISSLSLLMHILYVDFFDRGIDWNIENVSDYLKRSKIITTPRKWEVGGELQKRGGSYNALNNIQRDMYDQIRKN